METTIKTTPINTAIPADARIFVTDYASYNEGTQFEFGQWVNLAHFETAEDLRQNILDHFSYCDTVRPLACGTPREEIMISDFEGFPGSLYDELYLSDSWCNFEILFEYFERLISCGYDAKIAEAFIKTGIASINDLDTFFEELTNCYQGEFDSDKDFTMDYAEQCGDYDFDKPQPWPLNNIDWNGATLEHMQYYTEESGHYFNAC